MASKPIPVQEGVKFYPKRVVKKKVYDGETWETDKTNDRNKIKTNEHINITTKLTTTCICCNSDFPNRQELETHRKNCRFQPKESFIKHHRAPRIEDPRVVIEKMILPSSQPQQLSYADAAKSPSQQRVQVSSQAKPASKQTKNDPSSARAAPSKSTTSTSTAIGKKTTGGQINSAQSGPKRKIKPSSTPSPPPATTLSTDDSSNLPPAQMSNPHTKGNSENVPTIYTEITQWRRNLFKLPNGSLGKKFIDEKCKLLNRWASTEEEALMLLMMMPNLLLQRTSKKSKARENKDHLQRRLTMWDDGKLTDLMEEGKYIQSRLPEPTNRQNDEELVKAFRNHMTRGNVNAALRLLDKTNNKGILPINEETIRQLHEKHPVGEPIHEEMLLSGPIQHVHPVLFDDMNGELVRKVAMKMKGAAGPSCYDSDEWKMILTSRRYGSSSDDLCDAVARVAKTLCIENRTNEGE